MMGMGESRPQTANAPTAARTTPVRRCVLWVSPSDPQPTLISRLEGRGVMLSTVAWAVQVIVELAREDVGVLIICQPQPQPRVDDLLAVVQRYYPGVALWQYQETADRGPQLTRLSSTATNSPGKLQPTPPTTPQKPNGQNWTKSDMTRPHSGIEVTPLLTPEELEMLLGPAGGNSGGGRKDWLEDDGL